MYTVGQVANFLGVTRDTLKYYEEKELVKPNYDSNGYRKYNQFDIHDVITTNFYRGLDIEIKRIQKIRQSNSIEDIENVLEEKEAKIMEELEYKKLLLKQIKSVKKDCYKVKEYLGKFTIKEMKPIEVIGEMSDYTAYDEYEILRSDSDRLKKVVTLTDVRRVIYFDEEGINKEKFIVVSEIDDSNNNPQGEVLAHPKCLYTVIENGRAVGDGKSIEHEVGESLLKVATKNGHELVGIAYINILLTTYEDDLERVFVEMYVPIY